MREFGLTGGIGSGKSTVAHALVARGAALIDADAIVRDLQAPGMPVLDAMTAEFGPDILTASGGLDRQAVAAIVFADEDRLAALNAIVHPAVVAEMARLRSELSVIDAIVVTDIPLFVRADGTRSVSEEYDALVGVVVVDCDLEVAVGRLVEHRGFSEADARARMANQATRDARLAVADFVIDNSGSLADLEPQLDSCWQWMTGSSAVTPPR